ncbi:glycoside hydrolase family 16 protein [Kutzneria viridogrisea]|uniref:Secreted glucosidase n=2 Tax=Kutzneria TaxID=43356 RepID=W5W0U6_9PSEU|nr:carbohydrate-binding protein [Kutzneria albida]AHH94793.1 secreted glucosidase [Kutzneria albida DSM 43870]MBA8930462.1 beta-glucanase (GH16 family) [Kutzneria viridogrisea]
MTARARLLAAAAAFLAMLPAAVAITVSAQQTASAAPAPPPGFTTVWTEDFSGEAGSRVNGANWLYDTGTSYPGGAAQWGTHEIETMTDSTSNVYLDGAGHLAIKPIRDGNGNWTSGRIETQRTDFQPPPGGVLRVEGSLRQPNVNTGNGAGYWPAFWMLGAPFRGVYTNWPGIGELDIMEDINGRSSEFSTLHCGVAPGGPCNEFTGLGSGERPCGGCQTGFHTYAVELDYGTSPQQLRYYLDGNNFFTINANQVDATTWNNATQHGFFVILNVAIGGDFPAAFGGGPNGSTVSGEPMLVDYVTVSTKGGSGGTTNPPTSQPGGSTAYNTIAASAHADASGGLDLNRLGNGAWAKYPALDFGSTPATQFRAQAASGAASGVSGLVEVRLDSRDNAPIGSFAIASTGGWDSWRTIPANISSVTGVHDVYLTFTSGQPAPFVSLNSFGFGH